MRQSRFTTCVALQNGYTIVYNALNDRFVVSNSSNLTLKGNDIDYSASRLTQQLSEAGVMLEDDVDEVKMLADLFDRIDNSDREYHLHVNPTLGCNFRCWYCYEEHKPDSKMQSDTLQAVRNHISAILGDSGRPDVLNLSFFGGEPLLHFRDVALPIICHAQVVCVKQGVDLKVHFTTNGYLLGCGVLDSLKDIDTCFQITLDGSRSYHDTTRFCANGKGSYDRILENVRAASINNRIILRINYTAENLNSVYDVVADVSDMEETAKHNITVNLQRVWQDGGRDCEIEEEVGRLCSQFRAAGFRCSTHYMLGTPGSSCYGDKRNNVLINYNGDVFFCTARDFKTADRAGYLGADGRIVWENDALERRMAVKFTREECRKCRIAPICGGGCRQRAMEMSGRDGCLLDYTEQDKTDIVLRRFEQMFC